MNITPRKELWLSKTGDSVIYQYERTINGTRYMFTTSTVPGIRTVVVRRFANLPSTTGYQVHTIRFRKELGYL